MAQRRMFSKVVIDSDLFLDMSITARLLYYDLCMRADDDGFVNCPKKIMRMVGASEDDMRMLIARTFLIPFENGVVVIRHWRIHNYLRKDRHTGTSCIEQKKQLAIGKNNEYFLVDHVATTGQPLEEKWLPQDSIGKDSIGKDSIGKEDNADTRHKYGEYQNVLLSDKDMEKLKSEFPNDWSDRIEQLSSYMASTGKKYKNHLATIRNWARNESKGGTNNGKYNGNKGNGKNSGESKYAGYEFGTTV